MLMATLLISFRSLFHQQPVIQLQMFTMVNLVDCLCFGQSLALLSSYFRRRGTPVHRAAEDQSCPQRLSKPLLNQEF